MNTWSESLCTGHAQIDADHREFFRQLTELQKAIDDGVGADRTAELISILQEHALGHFQREELHMEKVKCRSSKQNCAAHREFARKLEGWTMLLCASGGSPSLMQDIHRESGAWMESHIQNVDRHLRDCAVQ